MDTPSSDAVRLARIAGAISLATDLANDYPLEKSLRTTRVAVRLAARMGLDTGAQRAVYWTTTLRFVGCTAFAAETVPYAAGDDNGLRFTMSGIDAAYPGEALPAILGGIGRGAPIGARMAALARFFTDTSLPRRHAVARCEAATRFASLLAVGPDVVRALDATDERFDGKGQRQVLSGADIPLAARIADTADVVERLFWAGDVDAASHALGRRRGGMLDPEIVDAACADLAGLVAGLRVGSSWEPFMDAEPGPHATLADGGLDDALLVMARFSDLKSFFTLEHSGRVSELADIAADAASLPAAERVVARRAALVHDVGRVAVPSGIWDKRTSLHLVERERIRSHSNHTETVLRVSGLHAYADLAGAAHERGHGQGYPRGLAFDRLPLAARIVAAADVASALLEDRPHRPRLDVTRTVRTLREMVDDRALDAAAVSAVVEVLGQRPARKGVWPRGLSDREVEVVRLVAVGRTNKEIGELLGMSPRTAQKHVMNVYDKLGVESRAGLALFAMEHGLLREDS